MTLNIRPATRADLERLHAIYAYHVVHGTGSWEYEPPTHDVFAERYEAVYAAGFPYLVAEQGGLVLGYSYASAFRPRIGYRFTCEDSIYVAPDAQRRGVARALLAELIARCTARGLRQMLAIIGDSENTASIELHRDLGFTLEANARGLGYKFGRELGWVMMRRSLAAEPQAAPVLDVRVDDPASAAGQALLWALTLELRAIDGDRGEDGLAALTLGDLLSPETTFIVARLDGQPAGCGALRPLERGVGEIKRMYTTPWARGNGVALAVLAALEEQARRRGYSTLRLETGDRQLAALRLYERAGYQPIPCYGRYAERSWSRCFEKNIPV